MGRKKKKKKKKRSKKQNEKLLTALTSTATTASAATATTTATTAVEEGRGSYAAYTLLPAGTTLALPSLCFHGSSLADFKNLEYAEAMQAFIFITLNIDEAKLRTDYDKFFNDHEHLSKNADFCQFVFAYCTHLYQNYHLSVKYEIDVTSLLTWGIRMRYHSQVEKGVDAGPGSENWNKITKYKRDIYSERGVIKCLARETPCGCMDPKKAETQGMDKTNLCNGCVTHFSKTSLFIVPVAKLENIAQRPVN